MSHEPNRRVLIVDACAALHDALLRSLPCELPDARSIRAGSAGVGPPAVPPRLDLTHCTEVDAALARARDAKSAGRPFAVVILAPRPEPGVDALALVERLWLADSELQCILVPATDSLTIDQILERIGASDALFVLRHPLADVQLCQTALALTEKWGRAAESRAGVVQLREAEQEARAYAASMVTMNRALLGARAAAAAAGSSKCSLLSSLGRELRAPMVSIVDHAETLGGQLAGSHAKTEHVDTILDSGQRLLRLVDGLLALGALESGHVSVDRRACSLAEVLDGARSSFASVAMRKGLALTFEYASGSPRQIHCDRAILAQILDHVLDNAIKFTDRGGVKVSITPTSGEDDPAPHILIDVEDSGIGISAERRAQVFEAFQRPDERAEQNRGGTGLGLTIARQLARLIDATIEFESESGRGSCFTIALPVGDVVDAEAEGQSQPEEARSLRGRVLLVEDVRVTQRLLSLQLRRSGLDVDVADDGAMALERLQRAVDQGRPFDVVLMDMQMPVLDGYEATRQLRKRGSTVPVIAVTARAMAEDRQRCLDVGCDDYLAKPVERADLLRCVAAWLLKSPKAPLPSAPAQGALPATARSAAPWYSVAE